MQILRPPDRNTLESILNRNKTELTLKRLFQNHDKDSALMIWKHVTDRTPLKIEKEENISYEDSNLKKEKGGTPVFCRYCGARDLTNRKKKYNQTFRKIEYGAKKVWFCNTHGVQLIKYKKETGLKSSLESLACFSDNCSVPLAPEKNTEFEFIAKKKKETINSHIKFFLGLVTDEEFAKFTEQEEKDITASAIKFNKKFKI